MILAHLKRGYHGEDCTLGMMYLEGLELPPIYTLEDPWRENAQNMSCIPAGSYKCVPHNGEKYQDVWRLENVNGRFAILIHAGNTAADTRGCILVGLDHGFMGGNRAVLRSKNALKLLRQTIGKNPFHLTIS